MVLIVLYDSVSFDNFGFTIDTIQSCIGLDFVEALYRLGDFTGLSRRPPYRMSIEDDDYSAQKRVFKALNSEIRLELLARMTDGPVAAPEVSDDFDVTPETIVNNLNQLEAAGFAESKTVRGPGGRPRKEFVLAGGGDGVRLEMEVIEDEYHFDFSEVRVQR